MSAYKKKQDRYDYCCDKVLEGWGMGGGGGGWEGNVKKVGLSYCARESWLHTSHAVYDKRMTTSQPAMCSSLLHLGGDIKL